ncbi:hypothetical protein OUZ56_002038 [Daphnia magna]|uniref:Uncharacterized protein n=1 Tax=Daphnia magna TaxID=35525 RepID=A0ABR0A4H9_9CRUS|nr:hypothetical protein OUZ56_002038 [Daphnia magna]
MSAWRINSKEYVPVGRKSSFTPLMDVMNMRSFFMGRRAKSLWTAEACRLMALSTLNDGRRGGLAFLLAFQHPIFCFPIFVLNARGKPVPGAYIPTDDATAYTVSPVVA